MNSHKFQTLFCIRLLQVVLKVGFEDVRSVKKNRMASALTIFGAV
jgi:hypothetical protein